MNTNDQWFNPGDRVMRVSRIKLPGASVGPDDPQYGAVYCVQSCASTRWGNAIHLVGMRSISRNGFLARNFRRVDEIKLCVEAAKHIKQREEELV